MENEVRLIDANALCEFFKERYEYLRNASETPMPGGNVLVDIEIQCGAIIAKEFLDKAKDAPTIDPESLRPKGRWRLNKDGSGTCSECHRTRNDVWDMDNWDNFCSHCGAKMMEG